MAWENLKVEQQRLSLITAYIKKEAFMTSLCKHYGVSRKTGYKWYNIYLTHGEEGLCDLPKAPDKPHCLYSKDQIETAIDLKLRKRQWGPKKIAAKLNELYPNKEWPSPTRLYEIFKDHHLVTSRRIRNRVPATSPLGDLSGNNDTWAIDLKGWFLTADTVKCEPLTITDCYSRYLICCTHLDKHSVEYVWPLLDRAFREYGLPIRLRSDNGPPFGSTGVGRLTHLSVNLIKAGVIPEWINPGHPEENGRHERFHLTLKQATAIPPKKTLILQTEAMNQFWEEYNFERPHEALGMKTPSAVYSKSPRVWNGILRSPEYGLNMEVRKVGQSGCIWYKQQEHYIGGVLEGEYIGMSQTNDNGLEVYYGPVYLGKLTMDRGFQKPKMKIRKR